MNNLSHTHPTTKRLHCIVHSIQMDLLVLQAKWLMQGFLHHPESQCVQRVNNLKLYTFENHAVELSPLGKVHAYGSRIAKKAND